MNRLKECVVTSVLLGNLAVSPISSAREPVNAPSYVRNEIALTQGSVEDSAVKLGFASKLSSATELYMSYQDLEGLVQGFVSSKLGQAIEKLAPEGEGFDSMLKDNDYQQFMSVAGEEVFFSLGDGAEQFMKIYLQVTNEVNKSTVDNFFFMFLDEGERKFGEVPEFFTDPNGALKLLKELQIMPMHVGFKLSDEKKRKEMLQLLKTAFQQPVNEDTPFITPIVEKDADGFSGFKVNGKEMVEFMAKASLIDNFSEMLGKEVLEQYKTEVAKHELYCLVGEVDDYIVIQSGATLKDLKLVDDVADSLVANEELGFARNYADKDVKGLVYLSKEVVESTYKEGGVFKVYGELLLEVLNKLERFGDTSEVENHLKQLIAQEEVLHEKWKKDRMGTVIYREDGYKIDSYNGAEYPGMNLTSPRKLAAMANHEGAVISGNWISDPEYTKAMVEMLEGLFQVVYKGAKIAVEQDFDSDEWLQFTMMFKTVDSIFSKDLLKMWNALKLASSGLGQEMAFTMDLKGKMPRIPMAPSAILDNGLIPRISYAKPVKDRAKLSEAWGTIDASVRKMAKSAKQMIPQEINIPKPERSEIAGLDVWSYQLGVTTKEANLALGVNDDLYFLTTSPSYLESLVKLSKVDLAGTPGAELVIRMNPMRDAARSWIKLLDKHGADFMGESEMEEFKENKQTMHDLIEASEDFEKIDIYTRKVDGEIRSTIHIKIN